MTAGNMAGFVRDHAEQLFRCLRRHQQAGMEEDVLTAGDEGIQRIVIDEIEIDGRR